MTNLRRYAKRPTFKFIDVGSSITGAVTATREWEASDKRVSLIIDMEWSSANDGQFVIDGKEQDPAVGDPVVVWMPEHSFGAIADGLEAAGLEPLVENIAGETITIECSGTKASTKGSPRKLYTVTVEGTTEEPAKEPEPVAVQGTLGEEPF